MTERNPSRTAMGTAYMRAAHQLLDAAPRILEDPVAVSLLGSAGVKRIRGSADSYQTPERRALRAHVVVRSRFAEDRLAAAVSRGVTQYIVLGAGFDTFAFRQPDWARGLRIVEVDHAGTQSMKRAQLAAAGLVLPDNAVFASVDFGHEGVMDALRRHGIPSTEPTLFSWLGVTMYLEEEAIDAVLRAIASFPAGSEVVLTFAPPPGSNPSPFDARAASLGEPWVSYFEPEELEAKLRGAGFSEIEFLSPRQAEERYFHRRPADLPVPMRTNLVAAIL